MEFYVALNGDTLEFQKEKPKTEDYAEVTKDIYTDSALPWYQYRQEVKRVRFLDEITPLNMRYWFFDFSELRVFEKQNLNLSQTTDLTGVFKFCQNLRAIDLSGLDVSQVKNMSYLFFGCTDLSEINLSGWNTSNVRHFLSMFENCYNLTHVGVHAPLSMKSAEDISYFLCSCASLQSADFLELPTNSKPFARRAFYDCRSLRSVDFLNFGEMDNYTNQKMLNNCSSLSDIRISGKNLGYLKKLLKI